jgi:hypothetical protein
MSEQENGGWHLDKRVPIAIIGTIVAQGFLLTWWGGAFSNRVENLERQFMLMAPQGGQIIRLEAKVDSLANSLAELKSWIKPRP